MTQQDYTDHPITPPPELVEQWRDLPEFTDGRRKMIMVTLSREKLLDIATHAARWGADQQLEQDAKWLDTNALFSRNLAISPSGDALRQEMRPKSPSLKEQALAALDDAVMRGDCITISDALPTIRRALEQLDD